MILVDFIRAFKLAWIQLRASKAGVSKDGEYSQLIDDNLNKIKLVEELEYENKRLNEAMKQYHQLYKECCKENVELKLTIQSIQQFKQILNE